MSERNWRWIWQPDQGEGAEEFKFRAVPDGYEARGEVAATLDGAPLSACTWSRPMRCDARAGSASR